MCRPPFRHGSLFLYLFLQITFFSQVSLSQRATCRILSSHKESTLLFEAVEGVGQKRWRPKRWQKRQLQGGETGKCGKKGGYSRDRWEDKSEIERKGKRKGDSIRGVERRSFFLVFLGILRERDGFWTGVGS